MKSRNLDIKERCDFSSGDCSGVYITTHTIDVIDQADIIKNTVVFVKDLGESEVELSTISAQAIKCKLNKQTAEKLLKVDENARDTFDKCFDTNNKLQEQQDKLLRKYRLREIIFMIILAIVEIYSVIQMLVAFESKNAVKVITSVLLVVISAILLTSTIILRRKEKSLWFNKNIEYIKFNTLDISRKNFEEMSDKLMEMGYTIYEST